MKTTRSFLLLLMLLATSGLNAQKEEDKYAALVSEVRNEVWSLNLPDFAFHTGSWGGMTTKVLYFLAAFIGGILPLSGYYLWLKKKRLSKKKVFRTIFETKCI